MSSQFDFENDINGLMQLNKPLKSGPAARWERKANEGTTTKNSICQNLSLSIK